MSLPSFKITLFPKPTKDQKFGVYLRITYNRIAKYVSLRRFCVPDQWNAEAARFRKNYPDAAKENEVLASYERRALDILRGYERDGKQFTFDRFFDDLLSGGAIAGNSSLYTYIIGIADDMQAAGRFGNSIFYKTLAASVKDFRPKAVLNDVSADWLQKYEQHCRVKRGMKDGGIQVNMRTLRSVCNKAIKSGYMPDTWYPFKKYSPAHLSKETVKRAIPLEDVKRLEQFKTANQYEQFAVDMFMFSFYARGMNLADIAALRRSNIVNGRIEYERAKTKTRYSIPLNPGIVRIIDKYDSKGYYIFPILSKGMTDKERYTAMNVARKNINNGIKDVARHLGFPDDIVFYTARHTYATALKYKGVPVEKISEALGHSDISTTQIYLAGFDRKDIDALDKLLE